MSSDFCVVYTTFSSAGQAKEIVKALLEKKLIACANVMAPHTALYQWEGQMEEGAEVGVLMKTRKSLFDVVQEEICSLHSYECPCIVSWDIEAGYAPYLEWVADQTERQ